MSEADEHEGEATGEDAPSTSLEDDAKAELLAELLEGEVRTGRPPEARADARAGGPAPLGIRVGRLVEWASGEAPRVDFDGNPHGPLAARSVIPLSATLVAAAIQDQRGVMLSFEDGRPDAPIITGLLQLVDGGEAELELETEAETETVLDAEARVDGRRVELEAADEIVLRCGKASIVLRRNGRVVIRGTYVETRSRGVNRIKGGSVEIN